MDKFKMWDRVYTIFQDEEYRYESEGDRLSQFGSENASLLIKIYSQIPDGEKSFFLGLFYNAKNEIKYLTFEVFLRLHKLLEANSILISTDFSSYTKEIMVGILHNSLLETPSVFDYDELTVIKQQIERDISLIENSKEREKQYRKDEIILKEKMVLERITYLKKEYIKKEFGEILAEDFEKVSEKIGIFKLGPSLSQAFKKIKDDLNKIDKETDLANYIGYLRTFLDELIKFIAIEISKIKDEKIPKIKDVDSERVKYQSYLKSKGIITKEEKQLFNAFHSLSSSEGSHKLISKRELGRLMTNILIELSLLILTRFETFKSEGS